MLTFIKRHYSRLFGSDTLKHEWFRLALSIITFFTMHLIMFSAMIVSDQRYYTNGSSSPRNPALRDLLYDVLPPVMLNYAAADKPIFVLQQNLPNCQESATFQNLTSRAIRVADRDGEVR
ncbi:hypothetical protein GQ42DRAFT_158262 [Ramicandelaber brevisporus]|nr:hypothetical protein GQ42DRAFT_158262 [Ramicandelaber brevisporus]